MSSKCCPPLLPNGLPPPVALWSFWTMNLKTHRKKSKGVKSGELAGHGMSYLTPNKMKLF